LPKTKAPAQTFKEPEYLRELVDKKALVRVTLRDDEEFEGHVEYWDAGFIRLTRDDGPNVFVFKHDLKYIAELGE
jgi:sRNA-binding regulator protein Hfq